MIHITLILVDLMSGLVSALLWSAGAAIAAALAAGTVCLAGLGCWRLWRRRP